MTLSQKRIDNNYRKSMQYAAELEKIAQQIERNTEKRFEESLNNLKSAWKGENAQQYINAGVKLKDNVKTTIKNIREMSKTIKKEAKLVRNAEMARLQK